MKLRIAGATTYARTEEFPHDKSTRRGLEVIEGLHRKLSERMARGEALKVYINDKTLDHRLEGRREVGEIRRVELDNGILWGEAENLDSGVIELIESRGLSTSLEGYSTTESGTAGEYENDLEVTALAIVAEGLLDNFLGRGIKMESREKLSEIDANIKLVLERFESQRVAEADEKEKLKDKVADEMDDEKDGEELEESDEKMKVKMKMAKGEKKEAIGSEMKKQIALGSSPAKLQKGYTSVGDLDPETDRKLSLTLEALDTIKRMVWDYKRTQMESKYGIGYTKRMAESMGKDTDTKIEMSVKYLLEQKDRTGQLGLIDDSLEAIAKGSKSIEKASLLKEGIDQLMGIPDKAERRGVESPAMGGISEEVRQLALREGKLVKAGEYRAERDYTETVDRNGNVMRLEGRTKGIVGLALETYDGTNEIGINVPFNIIGLTELLNCGGTPNNKASKF